MVNILKDAAKAVEHRHVEINEKRPTRWQPLRMIAFVDRKVGEK